MEMFKTGDMVVRQSYGGDILFIVDDVLFNPPRALLQGVNLRLKADSPLTDLEKVSIPHRHPQSKKLSEPYKKLIREIISKRFLSQKPYWPQDYYSTDYAQSIPGKVLHVDGSMHYLTQCLKLYQELNVPVIGEHVSEQDQPTQIKPLLERVQPDILIITGHDGLLRKQSDRDFLRHYRSSSLYAKTIKQARLYEPDKDSLVIIAGGCQSYFEALIDAGANFASSPRRVMIHCFDPVLVAERVAYTSFDSTINIKEVLTYTISGIDGIGGIQTKGKHRYRIPRTNQ